MKKVVLVVSASILSTALFAMDGGPGSPYGSGSKSSSPTSQRSLKQSAEQEKEIVLVSTLEGSVAQQKRVVSYFMDNLSQAISTEETTYDVDVPLLRTLLKDTYRQLPQPAGTISPLLQRRAFVREVESLQGAQVEVLVDRDGGVEVRASSPSQKRAAAMQALADQGRPGGHHDTASGKKTDLEQQVEKQVRKLEGIFLGNRRYAKFGLYTIAVFVFGMTAGWFYTTKAHHAAPHGGGN